MSKKYVVWTLLGCFLCQGAFAEETVLLEPISVKGTKDDRAFLETNESVSVVDEEFLGSAGRPDSIEVLNSFPNVQVNENGASFSIRGINNTGVTGYQKDNLASILVDDVFQTDLAIRAGSFDLWDSEWVEILRGAQSTVQGTNSLAGTILLNHHAPSLSNEGMAKAGLGNHGAKEVGAALNRELVAGKLAARASYNKELSDGYVTNTVTDNPDWGSSNRDALNVGLTYFPDLKDRLSFNFKYHRSDDGGSYVQGSDPFLYEVSEDQDYHVKTDNQQYALRYFKELSESASNESILAYSTSGQESTSDADGTSVDRAGTRREEHDDDFVSFENRFRTGTQRARNLLGIHAHYFRLVDDYDFNLLYPVGTSSTPIAVSQDVKRYRATYAIFDSLLFRINSQHALDLGGRLEYASNRYGTNVQATRLQSLGTNANRAVDAYLTRSSGGYEGKNANLVFLPKVGYLFEFDRNHLGASYTRAYRTGGVSINRARAVPVAYDPEFTNNYELSYRRESDVLRFSANAFYIDWRDQQVQVQLSNDFYDTQVQNASRSRVYGGGLEAEYRPNTWNSLKAGLGYTKTRFTQFETNGVDYEGKQFPFASNWTGILIYTVKPFSGVSIMPTLRYLSKAYTNVANTRSSPPQTYLDLNAQYGWKGLLVEAYLNNVLGSEYLIYDGRPNGATSTYTAVYNQVNPPREVGARLTYFW